MKQILTLLLALLVAPLSYGSTKIGDLYYNLDSTNKTAVLTYRYSSSLNSNYVTGNLVIPETVACEGSTYTVISIGEGAFRGCEGLTSVEIPNSVTSIRSYAFSGCSSLTSVPIPISITSIGRSAFYGCTGLTSVEISDLAAWCGISIDGLYTNPLYYAHNLYLNGELITNLVIPNSVTSIGNYAFYGCSGLTSVEIPNSVTSIGEGAFEHCTGLKSVVIPNSVTSIGGSAFYDCTGLKSVEISDLAAWWGISFDGYYSNPLSYAHNLYLKGELVTDLEIPHSITSIGSYAFAGCSGLKSVVIPNSVTSIGKGAFEGCSGLISVVIGNSVTSIGDSAFEDCSGLRSIVIGNSVTSIGYSAFSGCNGLIKYAYPNDLSFHFSSGMEVEVSISYERNAVIEDGVIFSADKNEILFVPLNYTGIYEIPNSVTSIRDWAFFDCSGLTSVEIPNSVTSIGNCAFFYCSGLTSVEIPNSVTSIGEDAFYRCSGLTSVEIPNSVTTIGERAFYNCWRLVNLIFNAENCSSCGSYDSSAFPSNITSLTIGKDVKTLPANIFNGLSNLTSVEIPNSVTSISSNAFSKCSGLTRVEISDLASWCGISFDGYDSNPLYYAHNLYLNGELVTTLVIPNSITSIGSYAFAGCSGLTSVTIPNSISSIGSNSFSGCSGLSSVEIPNSVTSIGSSAFKDCSSLVNLIFNAENCSTCGSYDSPAFPSNITSFTIGKDVKTLPDYVFNGLSNLTSVEIPNSVTSIGKGAFVGCTSMTSVEIPNSVTSIGEDAFYRCSGLTNIEIGNSVTSIGESAFEDCSSLTSVEIPNSVTSIGESAFEGCSSLISVAIPNSVTSIGESTFEDCSSLTSVTIPNSVTSIRSYAFNGCNSLTMVYFPASLTSLGSNAFYNCENLETIIFNSDKLLTLDHRAFTYCNSISEIYCNTARPPFSDDFSVFENDTYSTAQLYVPEKDLSLYYSMTPWSKFFNIIGTDTFPTLGVENIILENPDTEDAPYYNLNGQIVKNPTPGIYIHNGRKVIVK